MNMEMLRHIVEKESDGYMETVTFNYPKYEAEGTPHAVWLFNVGKVEESLENILEGAPWREEFPLIHLRREEFDENGRVIRVHFDIFGRNSMVKISLMMLRRAEEIYVMANQLATPKGKELIQELMKKSMTPELKSKLEELGSNLESMQIMPVITTPGDTQGAIEQIKALLRVQGVDISDENLKILNASGKQINVPEDSLTELDDGSDYDGPLDLSFDSKFAKGKLPFLVMPNPNPDDVN